MSYKELLGVVAILLTFVAFSPYIRSILKGAIKPHVFSWIIWGTTTFVVFLAQLEDNGGAGAWPIGVSGIITIFIAVLAYFKRADILITKTDWVFFVSAMSSLPFWYFTSDPLWAVVVLTTVDVLGFGPTVRKAYHLPHSESLLFFALFTARNLIVIMALENYSVTTVLFPAVIAVICVLLMSMAMYRRRSLATLTTQINLEGLRAPNQTEEVGVRIRRVAAIGYTAISAGVAAFQIALAAGAPWGSYAMGGAFPGRYPPALRVAAVAQAALVMFMAAAVLSRAGVALTAYSRASRRLVWPIVALGVASLVMNVVTPSIGERMLWAPVAFFLLACSVLVATGRSAPEA